MIFTTKSLLYTCGAGAFGLIFYFIFGMLLGLTWLGIGLTLLFAIIGFAVATFKIPDTNAFELTRKAGGEYIDKVFIKWFKFRKKGNRIYTYVDAKEETK